ITAIGAGRALATDTGSIRFVPTRAFAELAGSAPEQLTVERQKAQSSNTIVMVGERLFLKGYRRIRKGQNPEFEVGRFLTEVARFTQCAPVAGAVEFVAADGSISTLALLQAHVENQGDGWTYLLGYLERHLEELRTPVAAALPDDVHGAHLALMQTLGRRTAELHLALATRSGDAAFDPEPLTTADVVASREQATADLRQSLDLLHAALPRLPEAMQGEAREVLAASTALAQRIAAGGVLENEGLKIRIHGDYHLGQVLLTRNDFVVVDFEGEPGRAFPERRAKQSPLRDVAGMLRSFDYARAVALRHAAHTPEEAAPMTAPAREWEAASRAAFLQSYRDTLAGTPLAVSDQAMGLLALFELQKALYELRYELENRPDWVHIPLAGILALAGTAPQPA
ncbi:MAG TPA: putative maltokinase, partial [Pseudorhodoferax sp.]|nr:putative maltokinase [Pseudorhodoferax sp.]